MGGGWAVGGAPFKEAGGAAVLPGSAEGMLRVGGLIGIFTWGGAPGGANIGGMFGGGMKPTKNKETHIKHPSKLGTQLEKIQKYTNDMHIPRTYNTIECSCLS